MQKIAILGGALLLGLTTQAHAVYVIYPAEWNQAMSVSASTVTASNDGEESEAVFDDHDVTANFNLYWEEEFPQDTPKPVLATFYLTSTTGTCSGTTFDDMSEAISEVYGGFVGRSWWSQGESFSYFNSSPMESPTGGSKEGETNSDEISRWYGGSPIIPVGLELHAYTEAVAHGHPQQTNTVTAGAASASRTGYLLEPQQ